MIVGVPQGAMVLLIGPSGSGKSTFATQHFLPTEILSSDAMRAMVADDPRDQAATDAAFELLHTALGLRLARRRTTVVDATNVEGWARQRLMAIARRLTRPSVAIVLALRLEECLRRNLERPDPRPPAAIRAQHRWMLRSLPDLEAEGFARVCVLDSPEQVASVVIDRAAEA